MFWVAGWGEYLWAFSKCIHLEPSWTLSALVGYTLRDQFHWAKLNFVCLGWLHWETSYTGQVWTLSALVGYTEKPVSLGRTQLCLPWLAVHWRPVSLGRTKLCLHALVGYIEIPLSLGRTKLCLHTLAAIHWRPVLLGRSEHCLPWRLAILRDQFHWAELNSALVGYTERQISLGRTELCLPWLTTLRDQFHWAKLNFALVGYTETGRPVSLGRTKLCLFGWLYIITGETSFTGQNWTLSALVGYTLRDQFHWAELNFALVGYTARPVSLGRTELCLPWLAIHWETSFTGQDWTLPGFTERPVSLYKLNSVCLDWLHMRDQFHWAGLNFACLGWLHCQTSFTGQNSTECHL